jgi:hypothetical protein
VVWVWLVAALVLHCRWCVARVPCKNKQKKKKKVSVFCSVLRAGVRSACRIAHIET